MILTDAEKESLFDLLREASEVKCCLRGNESEKEINLTSVFLKLRKELKGF